MSDKTFVTVTTHRRAFPKRKFADGGASAMSSPEKKAIGGIEDDPFAVPADEDLQYQEDQEAARRKQVYGSDFSNAMTSGRRTAELAAPPASVSPKGSANREPNSPGVAPALKMDSAAPPVKPAVVAKPAAAAVAPAVKTAPAANAPPADSGDDAAATSSFGSPANKIDWLQVLQKGLGEGRSTNPISALGGIGGAALGAYLRKRAADREGPPIPERWEGTPSDYETPEPWRAGAGLPTPDEWEVGGDLPFPEDWREGAGNIEYAKGGKVSPSSSDRPVRQGRPMGRPAGTPPAYVPPPGSAANFPGGGPGGPQFGQANGWGPPPGGPPPGGPPAMGGMSPGGPPPGGPGINPQAMAQILANRAQAQGAVPQNVPMGGSPPGGPPPGGGAMGPMMPPGGGAMGPMMPPGGGLPPGVMPPGGPPSGPPPGAMPPGGPPSGPPPGAMPMGGPSGGPPPGMMPQGGPPSGPPPGAMPMGGPPSGPPPGVMPGMGGPPSGLPPGAMPMGPPPDPRVQAAMMARMQAEQQPQGFKKGGPVEDTEGFSPRAKHERVRQFGDVGKAAEDLPPEAHKKGGKVKHRRPTSTKKLSAGEKLPVPMVADDDMGPAPPAMAQSAAAPAPMMAPPPPAAPPMPPPGMAEGGVAKLRRGYPNTKGSAKVKKMAKGGSVRGCGAAKKGCGFSGVY